MAKPKTCQSQGPDGQVQVPVLKTQTTYIPAGFDLNSKVESTRSREAHRSSVSGCQTWSRECLALSFVTLRREEIDWAGLRAAAVAIGIRRAARQAALTSPKRRLFLHGSRVRMRQREDQ
jgi:hypothetical protein